MRRVRRFLISAAIVSAVLVPFARPASAGLLDGKVAIVTGSGRGIG